MKIQNFITTFHSMKNYLRKTMNNELKKGRLTKR